MVTSNTVRVVNISAGTTPNALRQYIDARFPDSVARLSLARQSGEEDSTQAATITFKSMRTARKALLLDNRSFDGTQLGFDADFLGLTALATPETPEIEYVYTNRRIAWLRRNK